MVWDNDLYAIKWIMQLTKFDYIYVA